MIFRLFWIENRNTAFYHCKRFKMLEKCNKNCMHGFIWAADASKEDNLRHCSSPYPVYTTNLSKQNERYVICIELDCIWYLCPRLSYVSSDIFSFEQIPFEIYWSFKFYIYSLSFSLYVLCNHFTVTLFANSFFPFLQIHLEFFRISLYMLAMPTWHYQTNMISSDKEVHKCVSVPFDTKSISHL